MRRRADRFWERDLFRAVTVVCGLFVVLTAVAMVHYPGGTTTDPSTGGYSFAHNFFSDLGRTESHSGQPNSVSAALFITALGLAGITLILFFIGLTRLLRGSRTTRRLSGAGMIFGVVSGACFVGIAASPVNLAFLPHILFVYGAFGAFTAAALLFFGAMRRESAYPRGFAYAYLAFASILAAYLVLLSVGPGLSTPAGELVQALGQKVIVYASLAVTVVQALAVMRMTARPHRGLDGGV